MNFLPSGPLPVTRSRGANVHTFFKPATIKNNLFSTLLTTQNITPYRREYCNDKDIASCSLRKEIPNQTEANNKIPIRVIRCSIVIKTSEGGVKMFCL